MRKFFAVLFTLAALATVAGYALSITEHEPMLLIEQIARITFSVLSAITAFYLFRPRAGWEASMVCPACAQPANVSPANLGQPRPSLLALLLGGIILTILVQHSQKRRFRCNACSAHFTQRTFGSWLAIAWCLTIILLCASEMAAH
jgi:hypothetical protein